MIKENERIDDLECKGLKIIQDPRSFCFGIDSILLADFAKNLKKGSRIIDLGTGNGILGLLLCAKTELKEIIGVEIQKDIAEMAQRSIKLNQLEEKFKIIHANIKDISSILKEKNFDVVVTNPPYKKKNTGILNEEEKKIIARHETVANLEDFIQVAKQVLKDKGEMYLIYRTERLVDLVSSLRQNHMEPKKMRLIYSSETKEPNLVLIKAVKNANPFLKIEKPLYIYKNGKYSEEILKIYGKEK